MTQVNLGLEAVERHPLAPSPAARRRTPPRRVAVECRQIDAAAGVHLDQVVGQLHRDAIGFGHLVADVVQQIEGELHLRTHLKGDRRQLRRDHNQFGAKTVNIRKYCVQS